MSPDLIADADHDEDALAAELPTFDQFTGEHGEQANARCEQRTCHGGQAVEPKLRRRCCGRCCPSHTFVADPDRLLQEAARVIRLGETSW